VRRDVVGEEMLPGIDGRQRGPVSHVKDKEDTGHVGADQGVVTGGGGELFVTHVPKVQVHRTRVVSDTDYAALMDRGGVRREEIFGCARFVVQGTGERFISHGHWLRGEGVDDHVHANRWDIL
jgi:hypothetical protein